MDMITMARELGKEIQKAPRYLRHTAGQAKTVQNSRLRIVVKATPPLMISIISIVNTRCVFDGA